MFPCAGFLIACQQRQTEQLLAQLLGEVTRLRRQRQCLWLQGVLADVSIATGYVTIALMLVGRFVFQYLGWKVAALATPAVMLLTGGAFFGLSLSGVVSGSSQRNLAAAGALAGAVTQVCNTHLHCLLSAQSWSLCMLHSL